MDIFHKKFTLTFCFVLVVITLISTYRLTAMHSVQNEVVRMFLEHMTQKQRRSVARVSKVWNFLVDTFPKETINVLVTTHEDRKKRQWNKLISNVLKGKEFVVLTEQQFAEQLGSIDAFIHLILRYPIEDAALLNSQKIKKICFDTIDTEIAWSERKTTYKAYVIPRGSQSQTSRLLDSLKKKNHEWSLYTHHFELSSATENTYKNFFHAAPHLKKFKTKELKSFSEFVVRVSMMGSSYVDISENIQEHCINTYNESLTWTYREHYVKRATDSLINTTLKKASEVDDLITIELTHYLMNQSDSNQLINIFVINKKLLSIRFPTTNIRKADNKAFFESLEKANLTHRILPGGQAGDRYSIDRAKLIE